MLSLNEKSFKSNSEQENSKEKLSLGMDVNIQFIPNSPSQCWDKIVHLNDQLLKKKSKRTRKFYEKCKCVY